MVKAASLQTVPQKGVIVAASPQAAKNNGSFQAFSSNELINRVVSFLPLSDAAKVNQLNRYFNQLPSLLEQPIEHQGQKLRAEGRKLMDSNPNEYYRLCAQAKIAALTGDELQALDKIIDHQLDEQDVMIEETNFLSSRAELAKSLIKKNKIQEALSILTRLSTHAGSLMLAAEVLAALIKSGFEQEGLDALPEWSKSVIVEETSVALLRMGEDALLSDFMECHEVSIDQAIFVSVLKNELMTGNKGRAAQFLEKFLTIAIQTNSSPFLARSISNNNLLPLLLELGKQEAAFEMAKALGCDDIFVELSSLFLREANTQRASECIALIQKPDLRATLIQSLSLYYLGMNEKKLADQSLVELGRRVSLGNQVLSMAKKMLGRSKSEFGGKHLTSKQRALIHANLKAIRRSTHVSERLISKLADFGYSKELGLNTLLQAKRYTEAVRVANHLPDNIKKFRAHKAIVLDLFKHTDLSEYRTVLSAMDFSGYRESYGWGLPRSFRNNYKPSHCVLGYTLADLLKEGMSSQVKVSTLVSLVSDLPWPARDESFDLLIDVLIREGRYANALDLSESFLSMTTNYREDALRRQLMFLPLLDRIVYNLLEMSKETVFLTQDQLLPLNQALDKTLKHSHHMHPLTLERAAVAKAYLGQHFAEIKDRLVSERMAVEKKGLVNS